MSTLVFEKIEPEQGVGGLRNGDDDRSGDGVRFRPNAEARVVAVHDCRCMLHDVRNFLEKQNETHDDQPAVCVGPGAMLKHCSVMRYGANGEESRLEKIH